MLDGYVSYIIKLSLMAINDTNLTACHEKSSQGRIKTSNEWRGMRGWQGGESRADSKAHQRPRAPVETNRRMGARTLQHSKKPGSTPSPPLAQSMQQSTCRWRGSMLCTLRSLAALPSRRSVPISSGTRPPRGSPEQLRCPFITHLPCRRTSLPHQKAGLPNGTRSSERKRT